MKDKLNILLINDSFPPVIDGVANTVLNYAEIINRDYGTSIVATVDYPNVNDNYPFEVLRFPSIDTTKMFGYRTGLPFNIDYLSQFSNKNIDIIHTHCPVTSTFLARILHDQLNKPVILTYHTKFDIDIRKAVNSKLIQDAAIKALVNNIEACDEVWVVSKGAGENLRSLGYKGDYIVMNNGVDFPKGKASETEIQSIKAEYHLNNDSPIYLFVGRIRWYKGLKIIIDALKEKKDHGQNFQMVFVGDGLDFHEVVDYTRKMNIFENCIFTGSINDRGKLKAIFSSCDLFLFPSTFDTNGIVVREAAASGLASVLVKDSCASEDTIDKHNVILIEENYASLASVLIQYHDNLDFLHQVGINAQNELYISWDEAVKKAVERYQFVLSNYQNDNKRVSFKPTDVFFSYLANISNILNRIKIERLVLENESNRIFKELNQEKSQIINEIKNALNKKKNENSVTRKDQTSTIIEKIENNLDEIVELLKELSANSQIKDESLINHYQEIINDISNTISDFFDRYF